MKNILVTGGCGFIGSGFVNHFLKKFPNLHIFNIDTLNYCSSTNNILHSNNYTFIHGNITNSELITTILNTHKIDTIVHFAAQSHVDNSFTNPLSYTYDNILGTHVLLECSRVYGKLEKFIHVSTDEVYGDIGDSKKNENSILCPTNPYAATKASAELIVKSYYHSFKMPIIITRSNNVFGPRQYPEKVIPKFIYKAFNHDPFTIQGNGNNIRSYIYIDDVVNAIMTILSFGKIGEIYNIGSHDDLSVLELATIIHNKINPTAKFKIEYTEDRPYNDKRYFICDKKLRDLGWEQTTPFHDGLSKTIDWYKSIKPTVYWNHNSYNNIS
jgi:dTDP-glucose 4,6-dehydratase